MNWFKLITVRPSTLSFVVDNLVKNSYYYFRVCAENAIGQSKPLESEQPIEARPAFSVPDRPNGPLVISHIQQNGCTISWAPPYSDGGSRVKSYIIEAREARRANWYQIDVIDASENSFKINDLIENNSYYFRVSAKNSIGQGEALESDTPVVIKRPAGCPDSPFPLLVTDVQSDSCTLEWKAPAWTGGEDLKGYKIEMRLGDGKDWRVVKDLIEPNLKTYTVQNLDEGNEYYFRISSFNSIGASKPLELNRPVIPKKQVSVPAPPSGPITPLTVNKNSISIQWGPPKHDGGAPLTRYVIYARELTKQNWSRVGIVDPETFSYQIENLTENNEYHFRIVAENSVGASDHLQTQEPIKAKSPYDVPSKPTGPLSVTKLTDSSATVSWNRPQSDGGSAITGYLIKRRDIKRPVWVKCGRVSADTYSINIRDLVEGSEYVVQVFAENSEGLSEALELDEPVRPKRKVDVPQPPASFECIGVDSDQATLQWEPVLKDGGLPVKSYTIEVCEKGKLAKGETRSWKVLKENIPLINTSYIVNDLDEGHEYLFRISAVNEKGMGEPKSIEKPVVPRQKVQPPSSPTGPLKVVSQEDGEVTISWNGSQNNGGSELTNYIIEVRDALKSGWTQVASVNPFTNQYKITGLNENSEYYIRVKAQNEANLTSQPLELESSLLVKSQYSAPSAPKDLKLVSVGKDRVTLEFKPSENDGGLGVRSYIIEKRDSNRVTWIKAGKVKPKLDDDHNEHYKCEIDELMPGSSYYFRVVAENSRGRSDSTCQLDQLVKLEKEIEVPSKPLELNVLRQKKPNTVLLTWQSPLYDGNDKINQYIIEKWDSKSKDWSIITTCDGHETSYLVNNLKEDAVYKFRVRAANKQGESAPSLETIDIKVQKNVSNPDQPQGPLTYTISEDQTRINLKWNPPSSDGGAKVKRYIIEKKIISNVGGISTNEWFKIGFTSPDETSYSISDYFVEDTTFSFRVVCENEDGYKSQPLELKTPIKIEKKIQIPDKPSYLRCKEKTSNSVTLVWKNFTLNSNSQPEKYFIEKRDKQSMEWSRCGHTKHETLTCEDLTPNASYYFRVIAANSAGESEPAELSELVSLDLTDELPSAPIALDVESVTQNSATLVWISPKNSGTKPIQGYKIYLMAIGFNKNWVEIGHMQKSKKLSHVASDLDHNYEYRFKVCAYSELGMGKFAETELVHLKKPIGKIFNFKKSYVIRPSISLNILIF